MQETYKPILEPIYHIFNKSIEKIQLFNNKHEYSRFLGLLEYYKYGAQKYPFGQFQDLLQKGYSLEIDRSKQLVEIYSYCIMPNHYHLLLKEKIERGLEQFVKIFEISQARYFNIKHKRKGHLWQNKYEKVLIASDHQFVNTTNYIHTNPVKSSLVLSPEKWPFSSYKAYISNKTDKILDNFNQYIPFSKKQYKNNVTEYLKLKKLPYNS